jgi:hypothetical protein
MGKVKLYVCLTNQTLHHEDVWGSGCIDPHILDIGTLAPGRSIRWVGGYVGPRAGLNYVERRKILPLPGIEMGITFILKYIHLSNNGNSSAMQVS